MNRLQLFPLTTKIENDALTIAGHSLTSLAEQYGTPLYVYDRTTMDLAAREYADALASHYPAPASVTYAGKAFLCTALAQWTQIHGLFVDCTGEGEIGVAVAGKVPSEKVLVHGVNKSMNDLKIALKRAGTIVVDNLVELERLSELLQNHRSSPPNLWLRLLPGVAVDTHHIHTQTGQHDSKFGMTREEMLIAAQVCKANLLPMKGIH